MDSDERKRKVEAGKAKLANYRKKKISKKKKPDTPQSTPRDPSQSEEVDACDSTAVQTGDDTSRYTLTPTDDSERSTTTADDLSTEEEGAYGLELSSVERIQELELTVSDQQAALKKLTLENKALREKHAASYNEKAILEQESVIQELRDGVIQSAQHVRYLQQQLVKTTDAVLDTGGEQSQVVAELNQTREKLESYQSAILRQEEALRLMAKRLEEKSFEAGEAAEKILSLQTELDKSQSDNQYAEAMRLLRDEFEQEKDMLKAEWDVKHLEEIALMQDEHKAILEDEMRKRKKMEEQQLAVYDPEDARAFREQAELLRSQLETAIRDAERSKREHDKEVIELSQQLVGSADEYELKLQSERQKREELEQRLDMSDTVSAEIQSSFSKQLEQLEEERNLLREQLHKSQTQSKDNSNFKLRITSLEDEVMSYQTELAELSRRLEEAEKQKRHFRDDMERAQETLEKTKREKLQLSSDVDVIKEKLSVQLRDNDNLTQKLNDMTEDHRAVVSGHQNKTNELEKKISDLLSDADDESSKIEERIKSINNEHSEELKNLHSQHHRQMDELRKEMEEELEASKSQYDETRKQEIETVKDVHERNHDRELLRIKDAHDQELHDMIENHKKEMETLKMEAQVAQDAAEERMRMQLKEEFDLHLEKELSTLEKGLEQKAKLARSDIQEKHKEELEEVKMSHVEDADEFLKNELENQKSSYEKQLKEQKLELDKALENMKEQFDKAQEEMSEEHATYLARMEAEFEESNKENESRLTKSKKMITDLEVNLQDATDQNLSLQDQVTTLQKKLEDQIQDLEKDYQFQLHSQAASITEERKIQEEKLSEFEAEIEALKEDLLTVQTERDHIFSQAEESQKRLAALHHEDSIRMQEELDQIEAHHQEKVEQMQYEIESLRASRTDLQDLKSQLLARNASVQELSLLKEEFAKEKEELVNKLEKEENARNTLLEEHKSELEKLKEKHREELDKEQERISQLVQDLEESREKLDEVTASGTPMESSPMRSVSQMSDYDSTNVAALNKDYRSAMTLTHVSGVSGLSESLDPVAEQEETSDEPGDSPPNEAVASLRKQLDEANQQLDSFVREREELEAVHLKKVEELNLAFQEKMEEVLKVHESEMSKMTENHQELLDNLKDAHQREITHVHLQCASDTAKQIEDETNAMREELLTEHKQQIEDIKQQMEVENSNNTEMLQKKHAEELVEQSNQLSTSLENRISTLMEELHEQKQKALQDASLEHEREISDVREDLNKKITDLIAKEESINRSWRSQQEEMETQIDNLKEQIEASRSEYKSLAAALESGDHEYLRLMKDQHEEEMEKMRRKLEKEHEKRQERALQKQADTLQQAQSEFMKHHKEQFNKFITGQRQDAEAKDREMALQLDEIRHQLIAKQEEERRAVIAQHNEEMKAVATKLVEVDQEKQNLSSEKESLLSDIEAMEQRHVQELADIKTALVNQHLIKFQEVTLNLDQLHKEEMESVSKQHQERVSGLRENIDSLQEKVDSLESALRKEEEAKRNMVLLEEMDLKLKELRDEHLEECKRIQDDHDAQLQQIDEEIKRQAEDHHQNMQNVLTVQSGLQQQVGHAQSSMVEVQKLQEQIMDLEKEAISLRSELEESEEKKRELSGTVEEWNLKMQAWDEERNEEREAYERKLNELSESLNNLREEHQDLNSRIEFERVEYESEIETAQDEVRDKDENIKELQAEIDHKNAALESLSSHQQVLIDRKERESQEANNLLKMLREDLERLNQERDTIASSNEQLLAVLSELVRSNHKCEELITKRLENLPIRSNPGVVASSSGSSSDSDDGGGASSASHTPTTTNLSGSFVDEGLDLSQRLNESMFTGPELDPSAHDVIKSSGQRVTQATQRALDMLDDAIRRFNSSQQAQMMLTNDLEEVIKMKESDIEDEQKKAYQDTIDKQAEAIAELEKHVSSHDAALQAAQLKQTQELMEKKAELDLELAKIEEEKALLAKQKNALTENRDTTEINLLKTTEELSKEKELLMEQHQQERDRLARTAHQLEEAMEQLSKAKEEKENEYVAQIEDLTVQIDSLRKQTESRSRLAAELTSDRQTERDQFDMEMEAMRSEIDHVRDSAKTDALLAEKVAQLEEELTCRQQLEDDATNQIEKLKEELQTKENQITDLQAHIDANKDLDQSSENIIQAQLEESRTQIDILQKELCENMLRTSALEAQLDRYRHGVDENSLASLERSKEEERRMKEQALFALEEKEQEIEHLVEQQGLLRNQIIEKEEEVEKLLMEIDDVDELKAENMKLKDEVDELRDQLEQHVPSQSDRLEALSQQLLDEKNADIDELRQQMTLLRDYDKDNVYEQIDLMTERIRELSAENERLNEQLRLQQEEVVASDSEILQEVDSKDSSNKEEDTGIQDLSIADLSRPDADAHLPDADADLQKLVEENQHLYMELDKVKKDADDLLRRVDKEDVFKLPPGVKEKIRDLEERLLKEKDDKLLSEEKSNAASPPEDDILKGKLDEIEGDLQSAGVLGTILREKSTAINAHQSLINQLQIELHKHKEELNQLKQQIDNDASTLSSDDENDASDGDNDGSDDDKQTDSSIEEENANERSEAEDQQDVVQETSQTNHDVMELKMILNAKEDELALQDDLVAKQRVELQTQKERMSDLTTAIEEIEFKFNEISAEFSDKCLELEEYKSNNPENLSEEFVALQATAEDLKSSVGELTAKISAAEEDRNRISKMYDDVQRECSALLEDNKKLEQEKSALEEELSATQLAIERMKSEHRVEPSDAEAYEEIATLQEKIEEMSEEIQNSKLKLESANQDTANMKADYNKLLAMSPQTPASTRMHAGGDTVPMKHSLPLTSTFDQEESMDVALLLQENECLKENVSDLTFRAEEMQIELEALKQQHLNEENLAINEIDDEVKRLNQLNQSLNDLQQQHESSNHLSATLSSSSSESHSSSAGADQVQLEELNEEHQVKMEEIKAMYAREMEEAVARATLEQEELSQRKITELEEKHRMEITELLSESAAGESELAQRLRNELDLADKLDHELINQLKSVGQGSSQPMDYQNDSVCSTSPEKEAEISNRLQHLLSRVHNEGIQVLSLSELQFLKQYQPHRNVSMNTDPQEESLPHPSVDIAGLKRAWENEKLALLDAIQSLKELLTQTSTDNAMSDDEESIKWRGELLRSVADLFERERQALLAELQASVIEAQGEAEANDNCTAASRLESLERKLRAQELQHQSELERLLAADRDQLADDIKQLKEERKEKIEQANKRIEKLQEQNKMAEENNKMAVHHLHNEVECLRSKLEQEEALTSDLRTSLQLEKQRSCDLLPALDRERNRTVEMSSEIAAMSEANQTEMNKIQEENGELRSKIDSLTSSLEKASENISQLTSVCRDQAAEMNDLKSSRDETRIQDREAIEHLQAAFTSEKNRRLEAVKTVEEQMNKLSKLHEELAKEKGNSYEEFVRLNNKCDDLTAVAQSEKKRCEELRGALEREASKARTARLELERERKATSAARDHERATVSDLQVILGDAKKESEMVRRRVEVAERERDEVLCKAEEEQVKAEQRILEERISANEALKRERIARNELQTALEAEKLIKQDLQKHVQQVEEEKIKLLREKHDPPRRSQDSLLSSRRQLESVRQRLQLEASKFQNLVDQNPSKPSPREPFTSASPASSLLSSDGEKLESLKRALSDVQDELKDLHSTLTIPSRGSEQRSARPIEFNDRLLRQNAELSQYAADAAKETRELRDAVGALRGAESRPDDVIENRVQATTENQQKMANRLHKLYTRYLRAESFRKSLVYQKKYLLLLLGGFQDCEEATLAMIARMGAYPSDDALRRTVSQRSEAFTKFRSAARVVIAVCRLKFLVRKWRRANDTVSTAIENKHGIPVAVTSAGSVLNEIPLNNHHTPSPSPRIGDPGTSLRTSQERHQLARSHSPYYRYSNDPPSRDTSPFTSGSHLRSSTSPYNPRPYDTREGHYSSYPDDYRRSSPSAVPSYSAFDRSTTDQTDPSLNAYIQKLENIQHKLRYPR